jgi:hypothetical protein
VQGTADSKAAPADAVETFGQIQSPPAALVTLLGANHYGLTDVDNPPGADAESSASTLEQSIAVETSARFSAMLLRGWVLDDETALDYLASQPDTNATVQLNL